MWARVVEIMLACWLAISPFIFGHPVDEPFFWVNDFSTSFLIALFALLSFHPRLNKMHLCTFLVVFWQMGIAFAYPHVPLPPALQNHLVVSLLLLMLVVIPSDSELPPRGWRPYFKTRS